MKRSRPDPIVESKLYPGVGARAPIARPRLDPPEAFVAGRCAVACMVAPAGYGKSTLMAHWHHRLSQQGCRSLWLSLDSDDNDGARFLRHLVAAFRAIDAGIGTDALAQLSGSQSGSFKPMLESLAADLARIDQRVVLLLDDLQFIQDADVIGMVDWLIHYSPRTIQYVIGSRTEPPLRLGSLRLRGQLHEIGARDLQFRTDEGAVFYASRLAKPLPSTIVVQLLDKTEGWPAGLELAALALDLESDREAFVEHFTGSDRGIVDYLGEAVLQSLDPEVRDFVFQIAQFDRVSAALAQTVTGRKDAGALLEKLHARNLFLIPLDRTGQWYRFHHLVGEFFRDRARRLDGGRSDEVLSRGAHWFMEQDQIEDAIGCALRARNWALATGWLARDIEEIAQRRGELQLLMRWFNDLPAEWVDRHPRIRIEYAFALSFFPRQTEVRKQLQRLEQICARLEHEKQPDRTAIDAIRCAVEYQNALSLGLADHGRAARDAALAWLQRWPQAPGMRRGTIGNVLGFGYKSTGELDTALEILASARRWLEADQVYYSLAWNATVEALVHMKRGNYREVRRSCERGMDLIRTHLGGHRTHASIYHALLGGVAYEFDEIEAAEAHMEQAMYSLAEYGRADFLIVAYLTRARLRLYRQDADGGFDLLREGQEIGRQRGLVRVTVSLAAEEAGWLCRLKRWDDARALSRRHGFDRFSAPLADPAAGRGLVADKAQRIAARLLLHEQPLAVARELAQPLRECESRGLHHKHVELLLLRAIACQALGQHGSAARDLEQALALCVTHGYRRVLLDDLDELAPVFGLLKPEGLPAPEAALLAQLRAATTSSPTARTPTRGAGKLVEALTPREVGILKRLDSGLSNKEIAEAIFISEGTLKWHLHNIYGKLGTKTRFAALARAKETGLL